MTALVSVAYARDRADRIRRNLVSFEELRADIAAAFRARDWEVLGYGDWASYVQEEFGSHLVRLTREERATHAQALRDSGLSDRAIAPVLGVDQSTIWRDLDGVANATPSSDLVVDQSQQVVESPDESGPASVPYVSPNVSSWSAPPTPPIPPTPPRASASKPAPVMMTLYTHDGRPFPYPQRQTKPQFNKSESAGISWAQWSWNPVVGCLHGCKYCYAREISFEERNKPFYPAGFEPMFHPERLEAPIHTSIPVEYRDHPDPEVRAAWRRVFVCSMADLYGRWVPDEWIQQVHKSMLNTQDWEYLLLTKFPARYVGLDFPPNSWVGTSVDEQKRVRIAEDAFRKIDGVKVKWLSLEPLLAPLEFSDLSMFDWVVIGAQTRTHQPTGVVEAFAPPFEWVARLCVAAKEAGCRVHLKPNLRSAPGMRWLNEYPV